MENNEAENLMREMSSRLDPSNIKTKIEAVEEVEFIKNEAQLKSYLLEIIDLYSSEKISDERVNAAINLFTLAFIAFPDSKEFFRENLEKAIIKLGFQDKKIDIRKMDPLNKIWNYFFV